MSVYPDSDQSGSIRMSSAFLLNIGLCGMSGILMCMQESRSGGATVTASDGSQYTKSSAIGV